MPENRYELRRGDEVIATGHLSREQPLEVGERIAIGSQAGIVRAVEPLLGERGRSGPLDGDGVRRRAVCAVARSSSGGALRRCRRSDPWQVLDAVGLDGFLVEWLDALGADLPEVRRTRAAMGGTRHCANHV